MMTFDCFQSSYKKSESPYHSLWLVPEKMTKTHINIFFQKWAASLAYPFGALILFKKLNKLISSFKDIQRLINGRSSRQTTDTETMDLFEQTQEPKFRKNETQIKQSAKYPTSKATMNSTVRAIFSD